MGHVKARKSYFENLLYVIRGIFLETRRKLMSAFTPAKGELTKLSDTYKLVASLQYHTF